MAAANAPSADSTSSQAELGTLGERHQPLREIVAMELRAAILSGRFAPGERLVEDRLAQDLGVSRNPVREAIRTLESEGLVEITPRRGATVAMLSDEEAREIFEVREALEGLAARLTARRRSERALADLDSILEQGLSASREKRYDDLPGLNSRFHALIAEESGNGVLLELILPLRDKVQMIYATEIKARAEHSWDEHREIYDAIAARDEELVGLLVNRHINHAKRAYGLADDGESGDE